MQYDDLGRRVRVSTPDAGTQQTYFDASGNLKTFIDGNGQTTRYRYDALHRLYSTSSADGVNLTPWDSAGGGLGRLLQTESPDGVASVHNFDGEGQLQQEA